MMALLFILWCGVCWVLRGGKYGVLHRRLFGREPGTQFTRAACAVLMAVPLAFEDSAYALLAVSIWAAMTIGYFDDAMGLEQPGRDHLWLAAWGFTVAFVMLLPMYTTFDAAAFKPVGGGVLGYAASIFTSAIGALRFSAAMDATLLGALAVVAYQINKPFGRRFGTDWTERAEFLTGAAMGAALYAGAL